MSPVPASLRATCIGAIAILLWATLALLTTLSGPIPPFQLTAMTFTVGFGVGLAAWQRAGQNPLHCLRLPYRVWALGLWGLFGYHMFYFIALSHAPAVDASLIAYLWPLLIVFCSALLPGERLRWFHGLGALLGFGGAAVLITQGQSLQLEAQYALGYLAALICAAIWTSYSLLSRRLGAIPTEAVGGFCGATAILAWICHFSLETTVWPSGAEGLAILALGLGPVGLAFFLWDYGVKRGNIKQLGVFSYGAPLLSTGLLILFGQAEATAAVAIACGLIVGGALLASLDVWRG